MESAAMPQGRRSSNPPTRVIISLFVGALALWSKASADGKSVDYDHRAILIDGQRRFLVSGSIHYPRSTPEMWPGLIQLAKEGGVDAIQTYLFWDGHEQQRGTYYFEGRYDLVQFLNVVHNAGLYVNLRIGPYISAEWNFGGLPQWLREVPGIEFRTDNKPFQREMQKFVSYIVTKMKENKLFYTQGGPIILTQVENEYGMIEASYGDAGARYAAWAGNMATNLNTSVPWIMCKQTDAPGKVIDTCNSFYCDDYKPNAYDKPLMWTENWPGWFHSWGISLPHRPVEDVAYATARFFQKGGSFVNYYMYHGGTNFARTTAAGVTTSYDYDAPIDEYGNVRQPKWGHLKDLHAAIKLCEPALAIVDGDSISWTPPAQLNIEINVYYNTSAEASVENMLDEQMNGSAPCAAFLANTGMKDASVQFSGQSYYLPAWSVSILPDCKNVVFNTAQVAAQTTVKQMVPAQMKVSVPSNKSVISSSPGQSVPPIAHDQEPEAVVLEPVEWLHVRDVVGVWGNGIAHHGLLEQISTTRDLTDYLWYTTTVEIPQMNLTLKTINSEEENDIWLTINTVRDIVHVFVNGERPGGYPNWNGSVFMQKLNLQPGNNSIALLSATTGLWYTGPFYGKEAGGLSGSVTLRGVPNVGHLNLTNFVWIHQVGLKGELLSLDSEVGVRFMNWSSDAPPENDPLVWYKTTVDAPGGDDPVVLDMGSMRKGAAWVNGHHLGRYWPDMYNPRSGCEVECDYRGTYEQDKKCFTECGQPSQRWYHVPREWLKPKSNVLILFEEIGGNVSGVTFSTQVVDTICSQISETQPPSSRDNNTDGKAQFPELRVDCGIGYEVEAIEFASFGNPSGKCGKFAVGGCHASWLLNVVREACLGHQNCTLELNGDFKLVGKDPCPQKVKSLAVQALCKPSSKIEALA